MLDSIFFNEANPLYILFSDKILLVAFLRTNRNAPSLPEPVERYLFPLRHPYFHLQYNNLNLICTNLECMMWSRTYRQTLDVKLPAWRHRSYWRQDVITDKILKGSITSPKLTYLFIWNTCRMGPMGVNCYLFIFFASLAPFFN